MVRVPAVPCLLGKHVIFPYARMNAVILMANVVKNNTDVNVMPNIKVRISRKAC